MQSDFEPVSLKLANEKLNKHVLCARDHKKTNDNYKKNLFKENLWNKIIGLFKK